MLFQPAGLTCHDKERATPGFTLFAPIHTETAKIINMEGGTVQQWDLERGGVNLCRLLDNGNLIISELSEDGPIIPAGKGGLLREYDWDGNIVWEHHDPNQHHDFRRLPNGNTVYIAWNQLDDETAKKVKGGMPGTEYEYGDGGIFEDVLREVDPDGNIVWEWHTSDLDMNKYEICPLCRRHEWAHANTCSVLPNGDIMVSYRVLNLLIIVDRQTGKVKWEHHDNDLGHQHDCHMLDNGNVLVFCNGFHGGPKFFSTILEFDAETRETIWDYQAHPSLSFYSPHISGMQRLSSGNTLICEGGKGCLFEVTPEGETVWEFVNDIFGPNPLHGRMNWVFRATRYAPDDPRLKGRL
ncbi:MAG: aryl sulfotransferase [Rhodospirillaceae bacterium]|nr:aryl sulfotransferase [Rhodospirillaceae bacterium]